MIAQHSAMSGDVEAALAEMRMLAAEMRLREQALLDRMDAFTASIHARIDRELAERRPAPAVDAWAPQPDRPFGPESLAGTGFYQIERDGDRSWRWFSPRVTLLFRDIAAGARRMRLDFPGLATPIDAAAVSATVNALPVAVAIERHEDAGTLILDLEGLPWTVAAGQATTLLVSLSIDYKLPPSGEDRRELSATFNGGRFSY